jgi:hypothetical protein
MTKKYDELDQTFDVSSTEIETTPVDSRDGCGKKD